MMGKPVILDNRNRIFRHPVRIVQPVADKYWNERLHESLYDLIDDIFTSNRLTSPGPNVGGFEIELASLVNAKHGVALSSCTAALMLAIRAFGAAGKEVILPSFTFSATAHAAAWNACRLRFADIDDTLCLDPADVEKKITGETALILAVHMYGLPCDVARFEEISKKHIIPVLYDAAHAIGASVNGKGIGAFGAAAAFSFSPTKLLTTVEGGMLVTGDGELAEKIRLGRNYSNLPDYQCESLGLSARMGEWNAALGLKQLDDLPVFVDNRDSYAKKYRELLADVPGISLQRIPEGRRSSHKDFGIFVDPDGFGMDRDALKKALTAENIETRSYFYPPVHKLKLYEEAAAGPLPVTEKMSARVVSLPIHNEMDGEVIEGIARAIRRVHAHADEVREVVK